MLNHLINLINDQKYPLAVINLGNVVAIKFSNDIKVSHVVENELIFFVNFVQARLNLLVYDDLVPL